MTPRNLIRRLRGPNGARLATVTLGLALASVAPRLYAQVRIGVVDIRRAVAETNEGRAASGAIKAHFDDRQAELDRRTKTLEATKNRLEKASPPTSPTEQRRLQKEVADFQQGAAQLQQLGQQYTSEIQQMEADSTKTILTKMQPIVREIALSDNYQVIVDEAMVHYAPSNANLTDRVIQIYNQRFPANPNAPPPHAGTTGTTGTTGTHPATGGATGATGTHPATGATTGTTGTTTNAGGEHHGLPGVFFRRDAGR